MGTWPHRSAEDLSTVLPGPCVLMGFRSAFIRAHPMQSEPSDAELLASSQLDGKRFPVRLRAALRPAPCLPAEAGGSRDQRRWLPRRSRLHSPAGRIKAGLVERRTVALRDRHGSAPPSRACGAPLAKRSAASRESAKPKRWIWMSYQAQPTREGGMGRRKDLTMSAAGTAPSGPSRSPTHG